MANKIIAAGHICLDITPLFPKEKTGAVAELLLPGTLLRMEGADVHTGGSVANTGLALRFFGADTVLMGKLGDDAFGRMILDILAAHGCESEGMVVEKGGVPPVFVSANLDSGDAHNKKMLKQYKDHIFYMGH